MLLTASSRQALGCLRLHLRLRCGRILLLLLLKNAVRLLLDLLQLERAQVERLQALNVLNDALLRHFLLLGGPSAQDLLQALYLHQTLLNGRIVSVRLQHL